MTVKYEITSKSQYANYEPFLYTIFFAIIATPFVILKIGNQHAYFFICMLTLFLITMGLIPIYFIHKNYFNINKGDELTCDFDNKDISYCYKNNIIRFKTYDIQSIKHYLSYPMRNKQPGFSAFDNYNYIHIKLFDGKSINVTSLLVPNMMEFLTKMSIDKNKIIQIPSLWFSFYRRRVKNEISEIDD